MNKTDMMDDEELVELLCGIRELPSSMISGDEIPIIKWFCPEGAEYVQNGAASMWTMLPNASASKC